MRKLISAKEARKMYEESVMTKAVSDITKMTTIMKNIKARAEKGFYYYDYQASISYAMAKTLIENGYKLFSSKSLSVQLGLEHFKDKGCYSARICWLEVDND